MKDQTPRPMAFGPLLALGASSCAVYAALLLQYPMLRLFTRERYVLKDYTNSAPTTGWLLLFALLALFASYAMGAWLMRRVEQPSRRVKLALLLVPLVCGALVFMSQTIFSTDLYDYLFRGRMIARYEANTFITAPNVYKSDPMFAYVVWPNAVSAYGPLWEGMSWLVARLAGETPNTPLPPVGEALLRLIWGYKLLTLLGYLLCTAAIWGALGRTAPRYRWFGMYLWLWNPLVLWETLAGVHNDIWMLLPIVLAAWALAPRAIDADKHRYDMSEGRSVGALVALTVGGLIKYLALMFGPLALVSSLRRMKTWRARAAVVLGGGMLCLGLIVLGYAHFWVGTNTLMNFEHRKALYNLSWLAAVRPIIAERTSDEMAKNVASSLALALLVMGVLWATWRSWETPQRIVNHMIWLLLWFLFVANPWFQPWYVLWPLALVVLVPQQARLVWGTILFCLTAMLSYLAVTFVLAPLGLKSTTTEWHALLSALVYIPPLVVFMWSPVTSVVARLTSRKQHNPAHSVEQVGKRAAS